MFRRVSVHPRKQDTRKPGSECDSLARTHLPLSCAAYLSPTHTHNKVNSRAVPFFLGRLDGIAFEQDTISHSQAVEPRRFHCFHSHFETGEIPDTHAVPFLAINFDRRFQLDHVTPLRGLRRIRPRIKSLDSLPGDGCPHGPK